MEIEILNTKEVATLLKTTVRSVQRKAESGDYPPEVCGKHGRYWLFNKGELMKYIFKNPLN